MKRWQFALLLPLIGAATTLLIALTAYFNRLGHTAPQPAPIAPQPVPQVIHDTIHDTPARVEVPVVEPPRGPRRLVWVEAETADGRDTAVQVWYRD